ncbi:MAG: hypothetical protein R6U63_00780 [Longimicrobiales bacterium]
MAEWWYALDADNRILDVGPGWDEFALENDAQGATRSHVVGRPLAEFVDGAQTRALLDTVLDRSREASEIMELPFRCDAPDVRRFMTWTGEPEADGTLVVRTRLLGEGERDALPFLERVGRRSRQPIRMCSWCNRIAAGPGLWLEADTAAERLGLFLDREVPEVTHGICPACHAGMTGELQGTDAA